MKTTELMNNLTRSFNKVGFKIKKHSPEILMVTGVVGIVTSGVMACRATLKVNEVVENSKNDIERIHEATENGVTEAGEEYSPEDSKKDLTIVYAKTGVELFKLYAPAVMLGALSISAVVTSNNILRKRNVALAAAYATVDKSFKSYRSRVVERFGEELDKELRYDIKAKEIEITETDEDGNEKTVTTTCNVADPNKFSDFARIWDDGCIGWTKSPEHNLVFLKQQQAQANNRLQRDGYLFLNDVYDMLGFPKTKEGQVVGWIYDEKNPTGDNFVDFGIYDINNEKARDFVNGYERSIVLDFNVDGVVWDLMS